MAYVHTTNRGSIFKKQKQYESSPDYSGEINVEGVVYFIDGWIRQSGAGQWLAISVKIKDNQPDVIPDEL